MPFFSLLAVVLGLLILIPLSIMGLSVIPWPILLILLLLILWGSQRLIDRSNSLSLNAAMEAPPVDIPAAIATPMTPPDAPLETSIPLTIALQYRGQRVENTAPATAIEVEELPQCYRGVPLSPPQPQTSSDSPVVPLRYRGIQR